MTYAAKIDKAEARIDWNKPAHAVLRHIHGLSPFPGAWCELRSKARRCASRSCAANRRRVRVRRAKVLDDQLTIACGEGAIRILELQRAGKAPMKAEEFLRGTPVKPPARLS